MSVRKTLATPSVNLRKHGYEKHTYVETRRYASFPHTYILVCVPTVSDRKSIHSNVILGNVRFSSETPPLRKISVRYVRNIRSKNLTFAVVLRRYRMKVFMFFTKHVSTWQAKLLADLFPSLVGFVFISVYVDPHVPKYRSPKNGHYHTFPHLFGCP